MTAIKTPKNSEEFSKWFEENQNDLNRVQVFATALDLITFLEGKTNTK